MADHFIYNVAWSEEDGEYVGTCAQFPSLSHLGATASAALRGIQELVADVVAEAARQGRLVGASYDADPSLLDWWELVTEEDHDDQLGMNDCPGITRENKKF